MAVGQCTFLTFVKGVRLSVYPRKLLASLWGELSLVRHLLLPVAPFHELPVHLLAVAINSLPSLF